MPRSLTAGFSAALLLSVALAPAWAQTPEDDPIPDEDAPTVPVPVPAKPAAPAKPVSPDKTAPAQPAANTKPPGQTPAPDSKTPVTSPPTLPLPGNPNDPVTLTRGQLNDLLRQQAELQRQIDELRRGTPAGTAPVGTAPVGTAPAMTTPKSAAPGTVLTPDDNIPNDDTPQNGKAVNGNVGIGNTGSASDGTSGNGTAAQGSGSGTPAAPPSSGPNNSLLLPDISFIGNALGLYSTDHRANDRSSFRLSEGEIGIQGYVYPGVKADAFITGSPTEGEAFQLEETYLTFLGVRPGLNIYAGRKFAPFGRTGEQHNHSWLYARQLLPRRDLIAEENLTGDGANFRYTRPFGKLYTQADFGIFTGEGAGQATLDSNGVFDPTSPFGTGVPTGTGAGFTRRFYNSRLYAAIPTGANAEFALGASYTRGRSEIDGLGRDNTAISGLDATYRSYLSGGRRILARTEYLGYNPGSGLGTNSASGYYGLLNYRFQTDKDIGLLYEESGFPQAPNQHESATSLIYTKQFTEQFYGRLQASHGQRPGDGSYNELLFQFVFGLGPHTHSLE